MVALAQTLTGKPLALGGIYVNEYDKLEWDQVVEHSNGSPSTEKLVASFSNAVLVLLPYRHGDDDDYSCTCNVYYFDPRWAVSSYNTLVLKML